MKKLLIFTFIFCLVFLLINAQSINITSPTSDDSWTIGNSYNITWTKSGTQNELVKIRLYNEAGIRSVAITDSTDNDGNYEWTVPATIPAGNYVIRVKTIDNNVYYDSEKFEIMHPICTEKQIKIHGEMK